MSAPPHTHTRHLPRKSIDSRRLGDGSLLGDTLMRQAHRLAPDARADTTHTNYFALKAMGIDPDTPLVPETRKRSRIPDEGNETPLAKTKRLSSAREGTTISKSGSTPPAGDDEALFASIRTVRETLAESTSWFQSERQSLERSMTPQSQVSLSRAETPAERRLRELKERGPTPTRTEIRQRTMTDKSFLPNGFWQKQKDGRSAQADGVPMAAMAGQTTTSLKARGFAALSQQRKANGIVNGTSRREDSPPQQKGGTAEEVIEL